MSNGSLMAIILLGPDPDVHMVHMDQVFGVTQLMILQCKQLIQN